jgi:3'(2'), 5'-bisphosphate nucleotidase
VTSHSDAAAATEIAEAAGQLLLEVRATGGTGDELKAAGDTRSHLFILGELRRRFPADAVLSEEGVDNRERLERRRVWIVDPLDGTREFAEPPRDDWAVHVALLEEGELVAGAVTLPALGWTGSSAGPLPARGPAPGVPRILVSRTRPPAQAIAVAERLGGTLVPMGSAGAKAMAVVRGDAEAYVHAGGQYEWDSAAPVAVARAADLHVSRIDGTPPAYNQPDPWIPDLLVCRPELAEPTIACCSGVPA